LVYYVGILPEGDVLVIDNWKDESLLSIPTPETILHSPSPCSFSSTWNISDDIFNSKSSILEFMDSAGLTTLSNQKNTPSSNEPKKIKSKIYPFLSRSRCFRENVPIYLKSSNEVMYLSLNIFIIHIYERLFDKKGLITLTKLSTLNMTNIRFPEGHNEKKDGIYEVLDSAILDHNLICLIPNGDPDSNPLKDYSLGVCFSDNLIEERDGKVIDIYDDTGINPSVLHTLKEGKDGWGIGGENPPPHHFHSSFGNELEPMCRIDLNRVVSSSQEVAHREEPPLKMWYSQIDVRKMLDLRFAEFQFSEGDNGIDFQLQDSLSNEIDEKMSINEKKEENIEGSDKKKDVGKIMNSIITLGQVQNLPLKLHYINGKLAKAQEQVLYHTYFNLMNNRFLPIQYGNKSLEILANFLFHT